MTDPTLDQLPEAVVTAGSRLSLVWLIPILALVISGWLVYKSYSDKGPTITISFSNAEGLEAGKTRVRYKDVDVGKVKNIELNSDLKQVEVTVQLKKSVGYHLNENTQFWIVRPRISQKGISGLNTLISGIYIGMDPGQGEGGALSHYSGRTDPLPIKSDAEGKAYFLTADSLGSLDIGSGIFYRQIQVGEVTGYHLDANGRSVIINIFINAPYDLLIRKNSRFWNASGFDMQLTSSGVSARLESLSALLTGGIAVDTPHNLEAGAATEGGERFTLLPNRESIEDKPYSLTQYYVLYFDSSIRGLNTGAPVEFRGIKVGEVVDIDLQMDHRTLEVKLPVLIALHPDLITVTGDVGNPESVLETLVSRGLRAQLASGNLITGQLFVDLDFLKDIPKAKITQSGPFRVFPTVPGAMEKITRNVTELLNKVGNIPLDEITRDLRDTISSIKSMVDSPETRDVVGQMAKLVKHADSLTQTLDAAAPSLMKNIDTSVKQLERTLATADSTLSEDSPLIYDIRLLIDQLSSAVNSFEALTDYLERHPNALLYGKTIDTP